MTTAGTKEVAKTDSAEQLPVSVRFTNAVLKVYGEGVGKVEMTRFQQRLMQNYFMAVDEALSRQEKRRDPQRESLAAVWQNVNMNKLSQDIVSFSRIGLDPLENNHISPVLFKNNRTGQYDISFIIRYKGTEIKARRYGLESAIPDSVIIELVYSTDRFKSIKRSASNFKEDYEFEITNEFDRGDIIGGFYYFIFTANPEKNRLVVMSKKEIDKRKPKNASGEFWGGYVDEWVTDDKGKRVKKRVESSGWYEKMAYKTLYRAAFSSIPIDSQKIDADFMRMAAMENGDEAFEQDYQNEANQSVLEIEDGSVTAGEVIDVDTGVITQQDEGTDTADDDDLPPSARRG